MIPAKTTFAGGRVANEELRLVADGFRRLPGLATAFYDNATAYPDLMAYDQVVRTEPELASPRPLRAVTNRESQARVLRLAACLESLGAQRGDAIGVLSFDRPEWNEAEMAVHTVGGRVVAAYVRDSVERLHYILHDSGCKFLFLENQEQLDKVLQLLRGDPLLELHSAAPLAVAGLICIEPVALPATWPPARRLPPIIEWREALAKYPERSPDTFAHVHTVPEDVACLFYTSGSNGNPKGVVVTHGEVLENLRQIVVSGLLDADRLLHTDTVDSQPVVTSLLPERAHVFPARVAQLAAVTALRLRFPATVDHQHSQITPEYRNSVRRDLREHGCGVVLAVPKTLIAIQQLVRLKLREMGWMGRVLLATVERGAAEHLAASRGASNRWDGMFRTMLGPLRSGIAHRIRSQIVSPNFECFVSGGAKLPLDTAAFLWAIGMPVYEGYGSTETNCPIAVNTPGAYRLGSVGQLFDGVEARVNPETRELLVRSRNLASRYWNLPQESAAAWSADGWYRTGDAVRFDDDGFLYIEDRVDQLLVLQNGEKVCAVAVENRFATIPYVDSAMVVGHGRDALIALVSPNPAAIERWAEKTHIRLGGDWSRHPAVLELLRREIQAKVNSHAPHVYEHVRQVALIPPPDVKGQTLTATEKIKRRKLEQMHAELIASLYADRAHWLPIAA